MARAFGPPAAAAAGAAVVGREVGIVLAVRSVADEDQQPGEAAGQSDIAEQSLGDARSFRRR